MSSHKPPEKPSNIPTDKQLEIVAERFKGGKTWGIYSSELKRFAEIMGLELKDFHGSTSPIFTRVPGQEKENLFLFNRRPLKIKRSGTGRKKEPLILSGEEIIKLAEEFKSLDLESSFLNSFVENQDFITKLDNLGYISYLDNNLGWALKPHLFKHDLSDLKEILKNAGIPEEGMRITKSPDNIVRLYIGRPSLQTFMRDHLPREEKGKSESRAASPPKGDSKGWSEESESKHRKDSPPGGLSLDEPKSPKDSGSPRSRGSRKK